MFFPLLVYHAKRGGVIGWNRPCPTDQGPTPHPRFRALRIVPACATRVVPSSADASHSPRSCQDKAALFVPSSAHRGLLPYNWHAPCPVPPIRRCILEVVSRKRDCLGLPRSAQQRRLGRLRNPQPGLSCLSQG
ncbi:hypothetical protein GQ53DRAFT_304691 [Thozetella sp. PMI_491]|nr:hypothetical protein GQ53DRAFT_304691 [Thozetella sp. PMI_491]